MKPERIRLFIKPWCGWCHDAIAWLDQRKIPYELLDVTSNDSAYREMRNLSGQSLTPTLEVDGEVLADFGVEELGPFLERYEF